MRSGLTAAGLLFMLVLPVFALAAEVDCLMCHEDLKKAKVVHAAVDMGCPSCHTGIDATDVPHKKTNKIAKGLSAEQPDLCYGCHDKGLFMKKTVHAAVGMGCTGCHNPHASKNAKLLISEAPDLCMTCHDKAGFSKKNVHVPVAGGMCLSCHSPHSTDQPELLLKKPIDVCLECHPTIPKKPHAIAGFGAKGHPLGFTIVAIKKKSKKDADKTPEKEERILMDPARKDKAFSCVSCHNPHSSDFPSLFRYKASTAMELCIACHKM